jgi:hypothetical protein
VKQNAGVVLRPDWSWTLEGYAGSQYDAVSDLWRAYLLPQTFDLSWPNYLIEGIPMRGDVPNGALCWVEVSKTQGFTQGGDGNGNVAAPPPPPIQNDGDNLNPQNVTDGNATATASPGSSPSRSPGVASGAVSAGITGAVVGAMGTLAWLMA